MEERMESGWFDNHGIASRREKNDDCIALKKRKRQKNELHGATSDESK